MMWHVCFCWSSWASGTLHKEHSISLWFLCQAGWKRCWMCSFKDKSSCGVTGTTGELRKWPVTGTQEYGEFYLRMKKHYLPSVWMRPWFFRTGWSLWKAPSNSAPIHVWQNTTGEAYGGKGSDFINAHMWSSQHQNHPKYPVHLLYLAVQVILFRLLMHWRKRVKKLNMYKLVVGCNKGNDWIFTSFS